MVAVVDDGFPGGEPDELPGAGGGEGAGFFARIGRFARDELRVGRIRNDNGQPELGGGGGEVFIKLDSDEIRRFIVLGAAS